MIFSTGGHIWASSPCWMSSTESGLVNYEDLPSTLFDKCVLLHFHEVVILLIRGQQKGGGWGSNSCGDSSHDCCGCCWIRHDSSWSALLQDRLCRAYEWRVQTSLLQELVRITAVYKTIVHVVELKLVGRSKRWGCHFWANLTRRCGAAPLRCLVPWWAPGSSGRWKGLLRNRAMSWKT